MNFIKAHVRLEGEANREWTLTKSDGSTESYYSIEGSPQNGETDERVYDYAPKLAELLDKLSYMVESGDSVIEYDVDLVTGKISAIMSDDLEM